MGAYIERLMQSYLMSNYFHFHLGSCAKCCLIFLSCFDLEQNEKWLPVNKFSHLRRLACARLSVI